MRISEDDLIQVRAMARKAGAPLPKLPDSVETLSWSELHELRSAIARPARAVVDLLEKAGGDDEARKIEAVHDTLMELVDEVNHEFEDRERHDTKEPLTHEQRGRPGFGAGTVTGDGRACGRQASGWSDQRGNPVRVLTPEQRVATERSSGLAFGDFVRSMVTGARTESETRALAEGTTTAGGYTVPTPLAREFIDRLRAKSVAIRAGARTVPMESQTLAIARLETDPTVTWRAENASIDESDPTFGRVLLTAKALAGIVKVSRELLADSVNVGEMLTNAFAQAMALELDRAAIYGDGSGESPTGVTGTSGINEVSMGTNGAAITSYANLIDAVYEMQLDNAADPTAMIMHPRTGVSLAKLVDSANNPLLVPDMIARIPRLTTTAASIAETQGTANNASSIVFGNFAELFIGMREEIRIEVLRERYADNGQIGFLAWMRADVQLAHKESFCRLKGVTP